MTNYFLWTRRIVNIFSFSLLFVFVASFDQNGKEKVFWVRSLYAFRRDHRLFVTNGNIQVLDGVVKDISLEGGPIFRINLIKFVSVGSFEDLFLLPNFNNSDLIWISCKFGCNWIWKRRALCRCRLLKRFQLFHEYWYHLVWVQFLIILFFSNRFNIIFGTQF